MHSRHVVIGAGFAGLSAALRLARAGHQVLVLEAAAEIGGRARSPGPAGFALNLGPHAIYPAAFRELSELGVAPPGAVPDRGFALVLGDRVVPLPTGAMSLLAHPTLRLRDKWRVGGWLAGLLRGDPARLDAVSAAQWLDDAGLADAGLADAGLDDAGLDGAGRDGAGRALAEALVRLVSYGHAPGLLSAGQVIRQLRAGFEGVRYVDGGWGGIVDRLAAELRAAGGEIRTRAKVEGLVVEGGRARGVRVGGALEEASSLVLTTSVRRTLTLLGEAAPASLRAFAARAVPLRAACLDLALTGDAGGPTGILSADAPLYLSVHTRFARLAPEGGAVVHVARYLAPGEQPDASHRGQCEALLDRAQPGWRARVVEARYSPAFTVTHAAPLAADGGLAGRPTARDSGLENVCLAGEWVGPEGYLADAALLSGRAAAEALMGDSGEARVRVG